MKTIPAICAASLFSALMTLGFAEMSAQQIRAASAAATPSPTASAQTSALSNVPAQLPSNYQLSPNDLIQVKVFQEDDMDWTVRVSKDGGINLPLVGAVNVARKTPDDLAAVVKAKLLDGYLVHPEVHVTVLDFAKRRFTILGQVQHPGQLDIPDNSRVDLLQAIGMAGGYTNNANPARIYIKRAVGSKDVVLTLDAGRMARKTNAQPFEILPGDTITVGETLF